jgi:hypothetical protein
VCSVAKEWFQGVDLPIDFSGWRTRPFVLFAQRISDGRGSAEEGADFAYQVFQAAGIRSPAPVCLTQGETGKSISVIRTPVACFSKAAFVMYGRLNGTSRQTTKDHEDLL